MTDVTVFRAAPARRAVAIGGSVLLLAFAVPLLITFGWRAAIAAVFAALIIAQLWWSILRPRLTADREGVEVLTGRRPDRVEWADIQRTEVGPRGTLIVVKGGREIVSRYPYGLRSTSSDQPPTEADQAAIFLAARSAWGRRKSGPPPVYEPPPAPGKST
jgi:hypothetical protein